MADPNLREETTDDQTQTAILLTQREWDDLAVICRVYRYGGPGWTDEATVRRRALCKRIEGATNG